MEDGSLLHTLYRDVRFHPRHSAMEARLADASPVHQVQPERGGIRLIEG